MIKRLGKEFLCKLLERQVVRLRAKHQFKIVAVGGSVGKTSTKLAIAKTLSASKSVIYQDGNYNDRLTVPLVLFGHVEPGIFKIFAWLRILMNNSKQIKGDFPFDIAVLELGTDAPAQMEQFAYLKPDLYVLTAVAEEHMEYFGNLDAVADEELQPTKYSKQTIVNINDTAPQYLVGMPLIGYGIGVETDYTLTKREEHGLMGQKLIISAATGKQLTVEVSALGEQGAKLVLATAAVADQLKIEESAIIKGLQSIKPVSGRMQVLSGIMGSTLLDDTYNASPIAVKAALDVLYKTDSPQRVAILGTMNEMGEGSAEMHSEVGAYCDPNKLDLVVTIGDQAGEFLAQAAQKNGCQVKSFTSPYDAGKYVQQQLKNGAVVLAKGSQNGVFAEEALKQLLADQTDAKKLVRQSKYWVGVKASQFKTD